MSGDLHQIINRFQQSAELLDLQRSKENLDDADREYTIRA